jgi:hypothetical protein
MQQLTAAAADVSMTTADLTKAAAMPLPRRSPNLAGLTTTPAAVEKLVLAASERMM